jgi:hypothetical protein
MYELSFYAAILLVLLPLSAYLTVKLATKGYLKAKEKTDDD